MKSSPRPIPLGRRNATALILAALILTVATISAIGYASSRYLQQTSDAPCTTAPTTHTVIIQNDHIAPAHTTAHRCDRLTITNYDAKTRQIAFGQHDHHTAYNGTTEQQLTTGQILTITLNKTGTYRFHDHFQDQVAGTFEVRPK